MKSVVSVLIVVGVALLTVLAGMETLLSFPEERTTKNPVELGKVKWLRNLKDSLSEARKTGKPVLIMFQEVPG